MQQLLIWVYNCESPIVHIQWYMNYIYICYKLLIRANNNATFVYIVRIHMFIYTYVYIVQKRPSPPIPRPCHAHKVDTSPAIRRRFSDITPKKSAIPRV